MDDNVLPFSELPAYLQAVEEEEEKEGKEQGEKGEKEEKKNGATPLFGTNRPDTADNHHDFTGHNTQLSDYSHCNNMDLIVKCSSFHVCQYASLEVPPLYCDTCGDEVEGTCFACVECEWCLCDSCLDASKLPNPNRGNVGGVFGSVHDLNATSAATASATASATAGSTVGSAIGNTASAIGSTAASSPMKPPTSTSSTINGYMSTKRRRRRFKFTTSKAFDDADSIAR
jgi:hypothetical protein